MENKATKKKSRKPIIIVVCLLAVIAGIGAFYWIRSSHYATTNDAQLNGNIYSVRSSVTAYLDTICFKDNQQVQKGDTLLIFNTTALKAKAAKAQAALEQVKTKLSVSDLQALVSRQKAQASHQSTLSAKSQIAMVAAKLNKAKTDFKRDKKLLKINAVTQQQLVADKATLAQAKAGYQQALHQQKSSLNTSAGLASQAKAAHHQISAAVATVSQYRAALALAKENLSHAYVVAPCNGIVTKRSVDARQYVLAGQSLCAVVDEQNLWVTANFKETQLSKIKPGQQVAISVDAYPDLNLKGVVQSYGGATGAKFALIPPNNATGNYIKVTQRFPLRIKIKDLVKTNKVSTGQDKKDLVLFPGLSVFVKVKTN